MLHYEQLLKDENKSVSDLPKEIRSKITSLNLPLGHLKKDPKNKAKQDNVERQDLAIAALIQDWIDTLEVPETPEEKLAREEKEAADLAAKEKAAADKKSEKEKEKMDKEKADKETADKEAADQQSANDLEARNKIVTIMNASSVRAITKVELTEILGRVPAAEEKIGDLHLYNVYLTERYKAKR